MFNTILKVAVVGIVACGAGIHGQQVYDSAKDTDSKKLANGRRAYGATMIAAAAALVAITIAEA